jgi:uncharacterized membrane protein YkgB
MGIIIATAAIKNIIHGSYFLHCEAVTTLSVLIGQPNIFLNSRSHVYFIKAGFLNSYYRFVSMRTD